MKKPEKRVGEDVSADSSLRVDVKARTIMIFGEINPALHLAMMDCLKLFAGSRKDVTLFINSSGGTITSAFAIYDLLTSPELSFKVVTVATGAVFSAALIIFQAGYKRRTYRHAKMMIHLPRLYLEGENSLDENDARYEFEFLREFRKDFCKLVSSKTGKPEKRIFADMKRIKLLGSEEALHYGLADEII